MFSKGLGDLQMWILRIFSENLSFLECVLKDQWTYKHGLLNIFPEGLMYTETSILTYIFSRKCKPIDVNF